MRAPEEQIQLYTSGDTLASGTAIFCGAFDCAGSMSYSGTFQIDLADPVLRRKPTHSYRIISLPDAR